MFTKDSPIVIIKITWSNLLAPQILWDLFWSSWIFLGACHEGEFVLQCLWTQLHFWPVSKAQIKFCDSWSSKTKLDKVTCSRCYGEIPEDRQDVFQQWDLEGFPQLIGLLHEARCPLARLMGRDPKHLWKIVNKVVHHNFPKENTIPNKMEHKLSTIVGTTFYVVWPVFDANVTLTCLRRCMCPKIVSFLQFNFVLNH